MRIDSSDSTRIFPNGRTTFRNLSEGDHEVVLSDRQVNCSVGGDIPQSVSVEAGETKSATFQVTCPMALLDGIAFTSDRAGNRNIHTMSANGTSPAQITTHSASDQFPAVSPDGRRIAFETNRDGNREIYTVQPNGSGLTRVTNDGSVDAEPTWSPDGARITFETDRDGNREIYTARPDGSGLKRLTTHSVDDFGPAWGPSK